MLVSTEMYQIMRWVLLCKKQLYLGVISSYVHCSICLFHFCVIFVVHLYLSESLKLMLARWEKLEKVL